MKAEIRKLSCGLTDLSDAKIDFEIEVFEPVSDDLKHSRSVAHIAGAFSLRSQSVQDLFETKYKAIEKLKQILAASSVCI